MIYLMCGGLLTVYTAGTLVLLVIALRHDAPNSTPPLTGTPTVTVQLPIYNERYVVERLLDAVSRLDYPTEALVIQLLDDSDDDTTRVAARKITQLRERGHTVQHIRRPQRTGYKAGALAYGVTQSPTDYYAIFDADFLPPPDFLRRTLPHLQADDALGMVQGRWGHLNPHRNALTAAQSIAIDGHFIVEQTARSRAGLLLNFNGTGGVWRADCIADAGGWQADTLTEDFDLSYRAQLRGWRMKTLPDLVVPGELPPQLAAFKQQQFRWAKGSTQVLTQMIRPLWRTAGLSLPQRVMGTLHLCQYLPYPLLLLLPVLAPPLLLSGVFGQLDLTFMLFSGVVPPLMYTASQWRTYDDWLQRMLSFPALILFGTGIALSNTLALLSALFGDKGEFRRTPKFGADGLLNAYALHGDLTPYAELGLAVYIAWGVWLAISRAPSAAPYLALSALSYAAVAVWGLWERRQVRQASQHARAVGD